MKDIESAWKEATEHARAGRAEAAGAACRAIIAADPAHAEALILLGRLALAGAPSGTPDAKAAMDFFSRAAAAAPERADSYAAWGSALVAAGLRKEAVGRFRRSLALDPAQPECWFELATALDGLGETAGARDAYAEAAVLKPDFVEAHHNLAQVQRRLDAPEPALEAARTAARLAPDRTAVRLSLGLSLERTGALAEAMAEYDETLRRAPGHPTALGNLARLMDATGDPQGAVRLLGAAAEAADAPQAILLNLANALVHSGRPEEALAALARVTGRDPDLAAARNSQGTALVMTGDMEGAISAFRAAIAGEPDFAEAHENLAQALLQAGRYAEGWREYEWRWKNPSNALTPRAFAVPPWDGQPLAGRTLLLHAEQGLGDALQFVRWASLIDKAGGTVILACQPSLIRLLETVPGVDGVVELGDVPDGIDCHAPLLGLPGLLEPDPAALPRAVPYVSAPENPSLPSELSAEGGFRIGFAWAGRRKYVFDAYRNRSCPARLFRPLAAMGEIRLFSLQKGDEAAEFEDFRDLGNVMELGRRLADFADDAAALAALDLVISVDTALAHLAGALGRPCWIALPYAADWRWPRAGDTTPFYPSVHLFRQPAPGDWEAVFDDMRRALIERIR